MDNLFTNMFIIELQKDFQQSITFRDDTLTRTMMWSELQGNISREAVQNISREAVQYLVDEVRRTGVIGTDKANCRCLLMSTMGLPCACSLAKMIKEGKPISLDDTHSHW
jgi:alpha-glucosidase